jgi:Spy/CpxP family protein refolding chaperone
MKKLLFITFTILSLAFVAFAQEDQTTPAKRPNLLQELGLSTEQVQVIRTINKTQKPKMEAAQRNFRQAKKALDDAVYADNFVEADVETKTKDVQTTQARIIKVKTETEVAIRKVLTPEQLVKFVELRQRLMQSLKPQNRPLLKQMKRFPNQQQP